MGIFDNTSGIGGLIGSGIGAIVGGDTGGSIGGEIGAFLGSKFDNTDSGSGSGGPRPAATAFSVPDASGDERFVGGGGALRTLDTPESLERDARVARARGGLDAIALGKQTGFTNTLLLEAKLAEIEDKRLATRSGLRGAFTKRRVAGASFEANLISQSDAEFARSKATLRGQEQQKGIDNAFRAIELEFRTANAEANREIAKLGIVSQAAGATDRLAFDALKFEQEMAAAEARAAGVFFGQFSELLSGAITSDTGQSVLDRVFGSGSSDDPAGFTSTGFNTAGGFDLTGSSASLRTAGSLAGF